MPSIFYETRANPQPDDFFAGPICEYPFPTHVHDAVEILCLTEGNVGMTVSENEFTVEKGDIAVVFPSVPHSYESVSENASGLSVIFLPGLIQDYTNIFRTMLPASALLKKDELPDEINIIIQKFLSVPQTKEEYLKNALLHLFLAYLIPHLHLKVIDRHVDFGLSYQVFHYISEHFTEPVTLESTARALGISRIHLSHIFSQKLKINFRQYINTLRIDRACILLRDPAFSVSQIVYLCGYGNPRTFHRAFLAQMNMTPNRFRKKIAAETNLTFEPEEEFADIED